ncbi:hypothetical protein JK621_00095 [Serratia plymuthica]|uniref:hypothetical protein n=1 Tax=Serratia plymuthica TaxID=82996 RepID=UPI000FB3A6D8|nr:hypothetical protein [Serratia plymuthica]QUY48652.1 hypothetical protein JK621_00095 [Serratia plymuthica]
MNSENIKSLYTERKPTKHDDYYRNIPNSVSEIFKVARNIVEHYKGINKYKIGQERYNDIDINQPEIILDRLSKTGVTSITNPIPFEHKIIGHCLTISIMALDMMRYKKIPSRLRYAYCTYFSQDIYPEQVLIEYWCEDRGAWLLGDPSMNQEVLDHNEISVSVDFCDVDTALSQPIHWVWRHLRKGQLDFTMYRGIHDKQEKKQVLEEVARIFVNDLAIMNNLLLSIYDYVLSPYQSDHLSEGLFQYLDEIADEMMASPGCLIVYDESNLIRCQPRAVVRKSIFNKEEQIFEV